VRLDACLMGVSNSEVLEKYCGVKLAVLDLFCLKDKTETMLVFHDHCSNCQPYSSKVYRRLKQHENSTADVFGCTRHRVM